MNDQSMTTVEERPMNIAAVKQHVTLIHQVMADVMKEGIDRHYGTIPGTNKPTLLQPGAQLIGMMFRLAPRYEVDREDLGDGHREYSVTCTLVHQATGAVVGMGVGSAATLESKWRYRWESTGQPVPRAYWKTRDSALLGGPQFAHRKRQGQWLIFEKIEHDNPADYYNTVLKVAKKRAYVDVILTATAASDIFTQDVEDFEAPVNDYPEPEPPPETPQPKRRGWPKKQAESAKESQPAQSGLDAMEPSEEYQALIMDINGADAEEVPGLLGRVNKLGDATEKKQAYHHWQARKDSL